MDTKKIGVLIGSLRKESYNRKIAKELIKLVPVGFSAEIIEIGNLSLYNQDFDENPPAEWKAFRERAKGFDAILFVTPEYNRSMPGVLKNALDVGSRPYGQSVWDGKPGAVVSVSPGALSAFGANHHLRQSLVFLNVPTMPQPEAYIGNVAALFDEAGAFNSEGTQQFLQKFMTSFAAWIEANTPKRL